MSIPVSEVAFESGDLQRARSSSDVAREDSNATPSASALQDEIRQLKRTLEIRRSEIALTSRRVRDLEALSRSMKETSLQSNERARALSELERQLQSEVERGTALQLELGRLQTSIVAEDAARTKVRAEQLAFLAKLAKIAQQMSHITHEAVRRDPPPPKETIAVLERIGEATVQRFEKSQKTLDEAADGYQKEVNHLQDVHAHCVASIRQAAEDNIQQRRELETSWALEEQKLQRQLREVRQRAREVAFHHHRGSGVKFDGSDDERRTIIERRVVHQECVELEKEIRRVEQERERERIATAKLRATLTRGN